MQVQSGYLVWQYCSHPLRPEHGCHSLTGTVLMELIAQLSPKMQVGMVKKSTVISCLIFSVTLLITELRLIGSD